MTVLHVEDDGNDALLIKRALSAVEEVELRQVQSVEEAVSYLQGHAPYNDREKFPFPAVLLTDLKLLGLSGFDFLEWVQKQLNFQRIPRAVVSSSDAEDDQCKAKRLGADAYFIKGTNYSQLCGWVRQRRCSATRTGL